MKNLAIIILLALAGCAPAISPGLKEQAGQIPDFTTLSARPEDYRGRLVILGGEVASVTLKDGKSLLMVSQRELGAHSRPAGRASGGNFLVESDEFLSPSYYVPQRQVTVAGEVQGARDGMLFLKAREIKLGAYPRWEKYYYPVPPSWYDYDRAMEHWYTPPYFDPWRGPTRFRSKKMRIHTYDFGHIVIDGRSYRQDVLIWPGSIKADWWRQEAHLLQLDDVAEALAADPQVLVVGQGSPGRLQVDRELGPLLEGQGHPTHRVAHPPGRPGY